MDSSGCSSPRRRSGVAATADDKAAHAALEARLRHPQLLELSEDARKDVVVACHDAAVRDEGKPVGLILYEAEMSHVKAQEQVNSSFQTMNATSAGADTSADGRTSSLLLDSALPFLSYAVIAPFRWLLVSGLPGLVLALLAALRWIIYYMFAIIRVLAIPVLYPLKVLFVWPAKWSLNLINQVGQLEASTANTEGSGVSDPPHHLLRLRCSHPGRPAGPCDDLYTPQI